VTSNLEKSDGLAHCSVKNAAVLHENHCESHKFELARMKKKKKKKKRKKKNILAVWRLSGSVHSRCFLAPLGVLFVMKTLETER